MCVNYIYKYSFMLQLQCSEPRSFACKTVTWMWLMGFFYFFLSFFIVCCHLSSRHRHHYRVASIESELGCNGGWLRQNRYVWAHWEGSVGLQCIWHRIKTLVRHACIPSKTYCSMAYTQRSRRGDAWWQKVNAFLSIC